VLSCARFVSGNPGCLEIQQYKYTHKINYKGITMFSSTSSMTVPIELSKETLLNILRERDVNQLDIFVSQYYEAKKNNPELEDFFNVVIDLFGFNCLELSIFLDEPTLMAVLIFAGAKPGVPGKTGFTPIHLAANIGALKTLEYLISLRVDLNARVPETQNTPLMVAAVNNQDKAITLLVASGAHLNKTNLSGYTAVGLAVFNNHLAALLALINAKASLSKSLTYPPVIIAVHQKLPDALSMLILNGANINERYGCQITGITALFEAVNLKFEQGVKIILASKKVAVDFIYGKEGVTAIFQAANMCQINVFKLLFEYGANIYIAANIAKARTEDTRRPISLISMRRNVYLRVVKYQDEASQTILSLIKTRPLEYATEYNFSFHRGDLLREATCTYGKEATVVTHKFAHTLGVKGSFGEVCLMQPLTGDGSKLAVKQFSPLPIHYNNKGRDDEVSIADMIADNYPHIINEARVNFVIHGVGAFFCEQIPVKALFADNGYNVIEAPRSYIAMKYFPGETLFKYQLKSASEFFLIFLELLNELETFHEHFIHCDIGPHNIIINRINQFRIEVKLIDFSFSRPANQVLDTGGFDLTNRAPEFKQPFVKAEASLDIFAVGVILNYFFNIIQSELGPTVAQSVVSICEDMLWTEPGLRISVDQAISRLHGGYDFYLKATFSDNQVLAVELKRLEVNVAEQMDFLLELGHAFFQSVIKSNKDLLNIFANIHCDNRQAFIDLFEDDYLYEIAIDPKDEFFIDNSWIDLFHTLDNKYGADFVDGIIMEFITEDVDQRGMLNVLMSCDHHDAVNPQHYQRLLNICNQIYRKNREEDPRKYYSCWGKFFGFSKQQKLDASVAIDNAIKAPQANLSLFNQRPLKQGQLFEIANRLRRSL
jgi:ankyrin repeat protein/serine/threonine protein kinase